MICFFRGGAIIVLMEIALALLSPLVIAQNYPDKPVRMVLAYPPGGGADILARLIGPLISESLNQQLVVDNRPGAGGNIGTDFVAHSPANGYTLLMASAPLAINVSLYKNLSFDLIKDFDAVTLLSKTPNIVAINPSVPARSIKELIELARVRPGQLNYASGGNGTTLHLSAELLKTMTGINIVHIPYKGTTEALVAVLAGESAMMVSPALTVLPQIKSGKLRALAVTSLERISILPNLPTVAESGLPGFEAIQWYGVLAPSGTPQSIISKLNREFVRAIQLPNVKARLSADASISIGSTPQQFSDYMKNEVAKWANVVKQSGARID